MFKLIAQELRSFHRHYRGGWDVVIVPNGMRDTSHYHIPFWLIVTGGAFVFVLLGAGFLALLWRITTWLL